MKAKLIIGVMYTSEILLNKIKKELVKKFGEIQLETKPYDFTKFTKYYEKEMGKKLLKKFLAFKKLIPQDKLADIRIFTGKLEEKFSKNKKRKINLDPGYLTREKLVLATRKPRAHKIYIGKGIYADLTLVFKKNSCIIFGWTFKDFKSKFVQDTFLKIRKIM